MPTAQLVQALAPAAEYVPAGQVSHAADVLEAAALEKVPASQSLHADAPESST